MSYPVRILVVMACALGVGCAAEPPPGETEETAKDQAALIEFAMDEAPEQGGCSNAQIRHCVGLCRGTVDACYAPDDSYTYTCKCRRGGDWTAVNSPLAN